MTAIELIEQAAERLEGAGVCCAQGTTNAFDEAAWLVLWRLGLPPCPPASWPPWTHC